MTSVDLLNGVDAVVFDAVGTLIYPDPPAPEVYAELGRRFGSQQMVSDIVPRFRAAFAREEAVDFEQGLRTSEDREIERWRRIVAAALDDVSDQEACFRELFEHFSRPVAWRCDPHAAETLEELARRGYMLGMASNYDHRLRWVVKDLQALMPIRHLIISSEVGWRKPSAKFYDALCRIMNLPAQNILYVGDDPVNDYEGSRTAGLRALLFDPRGKHSAESNLVGIGSLRDLLDL